MTLPQDLRALSQQCRESGHHELAEDIALLLEDEKASEVCLVDQGSGVFFAGIEKDQVVMLLSRQESIQSLRLSKSDALEVANALTHMLLKALGPVGAEISENVPLSLLDDVPRLNGDDARP